MFDHLVPNLNAWEWFTVAALISFSAIFVNAKWHKLLHWFTFLATRTDVRSVTKSITDDLVRTLVSRLVQEVPVSINKKIADQVFELRYEVAQLEVNREKIDWVLVQVGFRGLVPEKIRYAPVYFSIKTGKMAPAPEAMRYTVDDKRWRYQHAGIGALYLYSEFGAPPYYRVTGNANLIVVLGATYKIND
jgi:hypothetical protein